MKTSEQYVITVYLYKHPYWGCEGLTKQDIIQNVMYQVVTFDTLSQQETSRNSRARLQSEFFTRKWVTAQGQDHQVESEAQIQSVDQW